MSLCDGVNKYFIVYHDNGSMHFDGCKSAVGLAIKALQMYYYEHEEAEEFLAAMESEAKKIIASWVDEAEREA